MMPDSVFTRLFAGVPQDSFDAIPVISFGQWLLPIGIFLLSMGVRAEGSRRTGMFSLYRHGTVLNWWKRHFRRGMSWGVWTAALLLMSALAGDMAMGKLSVLSVELVLKISALWLCHIVSMAALFVLTDLFCARRFVPGGLLLLEGLTFIIGYQIRAVSHVMYGMWGMYLQSSLCEKGGFGAEAVVAAEGIFIMGSFLIGREYLKKGANSI